jgi:hypothetical protein
MNMNEYYTRACRRVSTQSRMRTMLISDYAEPDETEFTPVDILTLAEWEALDVQPPDFLMGEILSTTSRTLLAADTGLAYPALGNTQTGALRYAGNPV